MKSIIFNNNNNNNNGYWKKQAMLVNMLALSIIVLLLMIEQVNTKEVEINVDLKDEASKDTAKGEKLSGDDESHNGHPDEIDEELRKGTIRPDASFTELLLFLIFFCIIMLVWYFAFLGFVIYLAARDAKRQKLRKKLLEKNGKN